MHIIYNMNCSSWINLPSSIIRGFNITRFIAHKYEIIFLFELFLILGTVLLEVFIFLAKMIFVLIAIPLYLHTCFLFRRNTLAFLSISFCMIYIMNTFKYHMLQSLLFLYTCSQKFINGLFFLMCIIIYLKPSIFWRERVKNEMY